MVKVEGIEGLVEQFKLQLGIEKDLKKPQPVGFILMRKGSNVGDYISEIKTTLKEKLSHNTTTFVYVNEKQTNENELYALIISNYSSQLINEDIKNILDEKTKWYFISEEFNPNEDYSKDDIEKQFNEILSKYDL